MNTSEKREEKKKKVLDLEISYPTFDVYLDRVDLSLLNIEDDELLVLLCWRTKDRLHRLYLRALHIRKAFR